MKKPSWQQFSSPSPQKSWRLICWACSQMNLDATTSRTGPSADRYRCARRNYGFPTLEAQKDNDMAVPAKVPNTCRFSLDDQK